MTASKSHKLNKSNKRHRQHKHWKIEEDKQLMILAIKYNKRKWKLVAAEMGTRDAKQCRERYFGHLEEGIDKHPLSIEEDALILKMRNSENPAGWATIALRINETFNLKRTANQIKNNYNQRLSKLENEKSPFKTHEFFDGIERPSGKLEFPKCSDEQDKPHDFKCSEKQLKTFEYDVLYKIGKLSNSEFNNNNNNPPQVEMKIDSNSEFNNNNNITSEMKILENPKNNNYNNQQTPIPIENEKMRIPFIINL
ncbi:hypothetical protein RhiirA1_537863 [Rhizophagus irregularis]|uniref:Myb-like transcription factor n=1 Tax=Rhizophagus irregularis TaxID=588596 RepID=A0A2I1F6Q1_9GLOM|nr:hypothetical protein RhiirA1_537863 [Rhizophagus irregularis]PKY30051.1 hypothetical protein RhiirB3_474673 [Rhizophagus irregularis]CAB4461378.1 unnamed protein product [Rhizophagus irregularis]CAB5366445.1 unnamed protein product [Rhizophagus irregularis]